MKKKKGITLIALIVTIIVLLILAGIAVTYLKKDNLIEKAEIAKGKYNSSQEKENMEILNYQNKILSYINGVNIEGTRDVEYNECIIDISASGTLTVRDIENVTIKSIIIVSDNKFLDSVKGNTYKVNTEIGKPCNIYVIAVDEDVNLYKSNVVTYTATALYLYKRGDKCTEITNGWGITKDDRGGNTFVDFDTYNYIELKSINTSYSVVNIYTNNTIDLTNYEKLKMKMKIERTGSDNGYYTYTLGIGKAQNKELITLGGGFDYSTDVLKTVGDDLIIELDIKSYTGNYYVGLQMTQFFCYIYEVWLE